MKLTVKEKGQRLQALRKALNLTQTELAERVGADRLNIQHYEQGRADLLNVTFEKFIRYAIALNVNAIYLQSILNGMPEGQFKMYLEKERNKYE